MPFERAALRLHNILMAISTSLRIRGGSDLFHIFLWFIASVLSVVLGFSQYCCHLLITPGIVDSTRSRKVFKSVLFRAECGTFAVYTIIVNCGDHGCSFYLQPWWWHSIRGKTPQTLARRSSYPAATLRRRFVPAHDTQFAFRLRKLQVESVVFSTTVFATCFFVAFVFFYSVDSRLVFASRQPKTYLDTFLRAVYRHRCRFCRAGCSRVRMLPLLWDTGVGHYMRTHLCRTRRSCGPYMSETEP